MLTASILSLSVGLASIAAVAGYLFRLYRASRNFILAEEIPATAVRAEKPLAALRGLNSRPPVTTCLPVLTETLGQSQIVVDDKGKEWLIVGVARELDGSQIILTVIDYNPPRQVIRLLPGLVVMIRKPGV